MREFASLEVSEAAIAAFATNYGDIHGSRTSEIDAAGNPVSGSALSSWKDAIADFRFWFGLWEALQARNRKALRSYIGFTDDEPVLAHPKLAKRIGADYAEPMKFSRTNIFKAARYALRDAINEKLTAYPTQTTITLPALKEDADENGFELSLLPTSLLAVLWLHFATAVTGKFNLRQCDFVGCRKHFKPQRSTARYCSDICRVNAWTKSRSSS